MLQEAKTRLPIKLLPMVALLRADLLGQSGNYSEALSELSSAIEATKNTKENGIDSLLLL